MRLHKPLTTTRTLSNSNRSGRRWTSSMTTNPAMPGITHVALTVTDLAISEGRRGSKLATFTVRLSAASGAAVGAADNTKKAAAAAAAAAAASMGATRLSMDDEEGGERRTKLVKAGVAVGIGSAAIVAALLYASKVKKPGKK